MENLHETEAGGGPAFLSVEGFARAAGLSRYAVKKLIQARRLPLLRFGKVSYVPKEAGLAALERLACEGMDGGTDD